MNQFEGKSWEELKKPASQGGMSLGEGRVIEPEEGFQGTMTEGCQFAKNPWGKHRFQCYSNMNSVEYFRCTYDGCDAEFVD